MIEKIYYVDIANKQNVIDAIKSLEKRDPEFCTRYNVDAGKDFLCFKFDEHEHFIGFANYFNNPEKYKLRCFNLEFSSNLGKISSLLENQTKSKLLRYTYSLLSKCFPNKFIGYEQDKDQLQGEEVSDSRRDERNIFHYRRDKSQFATGRHCDEAGIKVQTERTGRYQIIVSSRCSKVLGC